MRESSRPGAWSTDYVLTTAEFAAMCRWLLAKHRNEYIHVYTDDEPGSQRTGGHIFEGVMADSISYSDSNNLRFTASPRSEHWSVSEHIGRIRSIEYNRSRFWHGDHGWVQQHGRLPKGAERPFFDEMKPYLIERP